MRFLLECVGQRSKRRSFPEPVRQRPSQQPVGKPWVPGQQRPVEIRADRRSDPAALETARAVVAEARNDAAERLRTSLEPSEPRVVLEARQRVLFARLELAFEQAVPDQPPLARNRVERKQPGARKLGASSITIEAPQ